MQNTNTDAHKHWFITEVILDQHLITYSCIIPITILSSFISHWQHSTTKMVICTQRGGTAY